MSTKEVPRNEWQKFFHDFTRFHQGWIASVDVFSGSFGAQKEANELVFSGITAAPASGGGQTIEVMLGENHDHHLTHIITAPVSVHFESEAESEVLQICDADNTTVLISCHRSALPAKVNYGGLQVT